MDERCARSLACGMHWSWSGGILKTTAGGQQSEESRAWVAALTPSFSSLNYRRLGRICMGTRDPQRHSGQKNKQKKTTTTNHASLSTASPLPCSLGRLWTPGRRGCSSPRSGLRQRLGLPALPALAVPLQALSEVRLSTGTPLSLLLLAPKPCLQQQRCCSSSGKQHLPHAPASPFKESPGQ